MKILDRLTTSVEPLLCSEFFMVLPLMFTPFTRGQKKKSTVEEEDDLIWAENDKTYWPPSSNTIRDDGVPR